jgi:putative two-component system response regulator
VSDLLLLKQTSLTEEEYREVQQHTLIGGRVLKAIYDRTPNQHYFAMAITIAEGHHEYFNGGGYPRGIKGEDIPLCCRILAVANVYDSCITDRVFRKAYSHEEACEIVRNGRGTRFDPRIVDVFEKICDKFPGHKITSNLSSYRSAMEFFQ